MLVDRYCAAVADDGVEVERILAFTFTERAAAEMRTRVRRELAARARATRAGGDVARADELLRAARATERAWVMTIHAFCRRLLASHPLAAGLDPRFRVLDAGEAARLADRAADEALARPARLRRRGRRPGDGGLPAVAADRDAAHRPHEPAQPGHARAAPAGGPRPVHSPGRKEEPRELTPAEVEAARSSRRALELLLEALRAAATRELKEERSALDFQDLELRALELLRVEPGARRRPGASGSRT